MTSDPDPTALGVGAAAGRRHHLGRLHHPRHRRGRERPRHVHQPRHSGYLIRDTIFQDNGIGLHLGASGEHPTLVCRNRFVANNEFAEGGYGIFSDEGAEQVLITYNRFERHNGAGVFFADRGRPQRDVLIDHNKSVDDMSFATIFDSSRVRVSFNKVRARVDDPEFPERGLGDLHRRPQRRRARPQEPGHGRPAATAST